MLTALIPTDLISVLANQDSLEMDPIVLTSMNVQKMEAHVTKTRSVLIMMDHTLVSVRTDLQEMEQFVWISMSVKLLTCVMKTRTALTPTDLTLVLANWASLEMVFLVEMLMNV